MGHFCFKHLEYDKTKTGQKSSSKISSFDAELMDSSNLKSETVNIYDN